MQIVRGRAPETTPTQSRTETFTGTVWGDPVLPTWGKVVNDAYANGALYKGYYYWVLAPSVLLMLTGAGFALVGFALDRVFNPRLRTL